MLLGGILGGGEPFDCTISNILAVIGVHDFWQLLCAC